MRAHETNFQPDIDRCNELGFFGKIVFAWGAIELIGIAVFLCIIIPSCGTVKKATRKSEHSRDSVATLKIETGNSLTIDSTGFTLSGKKATTELTEEYEREIVHEYFVTGDSAKRFWLAGHPTMAGGGGSYIPAKTTIKEKGRVTQLQTNTDTLSQSSIKTSNAASSSKSEAAVQVQEKISQQSKQAETKSGFPWGLALTLTGLFLLVVYGASFLMGEAPGVGWLLTLIKKRRQK